MYAYGPGLDAPAAAPPALGPAPAALGPAPAALGPAPAALDPCAAAAQCGKYGAALALLCGELLNGPPEIGRAHV